MAHVCCKVLDKKSHDIARLDHMAVSMVPKVKECSTLKIPDSSNLMHGKGFILRTYVDLTQVTSHVTFFKVILSVSCILLKFSVLSFLNPNPWNCFFPNRFTC